MQTSCTHVNISETCLSHVHSTARHRPNKHSFHWTREVRRVCVSVCVCVCVCALYLTPPCCSPLRSCPERPGPQVVLCLGMRSEVRNGVCLCSSRYARSSRWAELVAVCLRVWRKEQDISEKRKRRYYCQHVCVHWETHTVNKPIICIHTKEGGTGACQCPEAVVRLPLSYLLTPTGKSKPALHGSVLKIPPLSVCHAARRQMPSGPSQD